MLGGAVRAPAQDPFEIQVYEYETVPSGWWDLGTHVNYGATGPLTRVEPRASQQHQIFPGADINMSPDIVLTLGVGFGLTNAGNTLVYKTRLGGCFEG